MGSEFEQRADSSARDVDGAQIVVPHEREFGPTTALKFGVLHSSLKQLEHLGFAQRYLEVVEPEVVQQVREGLPSAWAPIELGHAHYAACDVLALSADALSKMGQAVGDRMQGTALVSAAKKTRDANFDVWNAVGQLHRVWARLYQGGSVQVVRLGPKEKLLEQKGFTLNRHRHYRYAQLAALAAGYAAVGNHVDSIKIVTYRAATDELQIRITWA